jgi:hypothetical protein
MFFMGLGRGIPAIIKYAHVVVVRVHGDFRKNRENRIVERETIAIARFL